MKKKSIIYGVIIPLTLLIIVVMISSLRPDDCKNGVRKIILKNDEDLIFFPSMAEYDRKKHIWRVAVHAWVYEPETESAKRNALIASFKKVLGLSDHDEYSGHFESLARYLMVDQEGGKDVAVAIDWRL